MATQKELKSLSDPIVYIDGRRIKILPNSCTSELPGEVNTRAVSAGGGSHDVVHGYNVEEATAMVKFDVANTAEMVEFVLDYSARAKIIAGSTIKLIEDTIQLGYDNMVLTNKVEKSWEAEGTISLEFTGRYAGL